MSVWLRSVPGSRGRVRAPVPVPRLVDRPPVGAVGHSFACGMECCDRFAVGEVNQRGRPRRAPGVMTVTTRAHRGFGDLVTPPAWVRAWTGGGRGRRVARRRPARSVRGRRRRRRCCGRGGRRPGRGPAPRRVCAGTRCTASTAAQRTSRLPCLVIRPRCTVVSDSWCFGVSPAHEASCCGPVEAGDVADLGDEHRGQHRPDPGDLLDRAIAGVGRAAGRRRAWRTARSRSPARSISRSRRVDPGPRLRRQPRRGEQLLPARAEQVAHRHLHTGGGEHRVDLALQARSAARPAWPGAAPSRAAPGWPVGRSTPRATGPSAADRPDRRRRAGRSSPADRRTSSPPAGAPDARARRARRGCPRPSTTRRSPRAPPPAPRPARSITCRRYSGSLEIRTVSNVLAGLGHPHQHRPAPMQIHPDDLLARVLFAHRGLLESMDVSTPSMSRESRGAEAPLLHRIKLSV